MGSVVEQGGHGLKQVNDISGAHVLVLTQVVNDCSEHLVSIRDTNKQLGDALVVRGLY